MVGSIEFIAIANRAELTKGAGQHRFGLPPYKTLGIEAVADQIGDVDEAQTVALRVLRQLGEAGHGPVWVLDLADDACWVEPCHSGQVNGGLGMSGPLEDAALLGPKRKDVPRTPQVVRAGVWVDGHLNGPGPVLCGDPRRDTVLGAGIHADGEGGLVAVGVAINHQG